MSTFSEPTYHSEGNKIRVSMMLKVPIDIELDLLGMPPIPNSQANGSLTGDSESTVVITGEGQADFHEEIRTLSNQLVAQLLQGHQVISKIPQTQQEQDNLGNQEGGTDQAKLSSVSSCFLEEKAAIQPVIPEEILEKTGQPLSEQPFDQLSVSWTSLGVTDSVQEFPLPTFGEGSPVFSEFEYTPALDKKPTGRLIRLIQ